MLAAIADGTSRLQGYAPGADCAATLACLEGYGVSVRRSSGPHGLNIEIDGLGLRGLRAPDRPLDAANSGTSMRLLSGLAAAHPFRTVLSGDESLSRRPMRRVIDPLTKMGATIAAVDGHPPLTIDGTDLEPIRYAPQVPSAQVKSAVLLAGLHARGRTEVVEPAPTRDHTERAFEAFGLRVERQGPAVSIEGGGRLRAVDLPVPGDISSAIFWLVLAAGHPGSAVEIEGVGLNPTRSALLDVLREAGADLEVQAAGGPTQGGEPLGTIRLRASSPRAFHVGPAMVPAVIDEIPALAALAAMTPGGQMTVRGAGELRVKESDRIAMLARGFRAMGLRVDEYDDGFTIYGGRLDGGVVDAAGDHRLAMAFAIAGTAAAAPVSIRGAEAVAVSYPGFFSELKRLSEAGDDR
jgi:3-phosphoshikimate 1-carboxyvinyltransferase